MEKIKASNSIFAQPVSSLILHEEVVTCIKTETIYQVVNKMVASNIGSIIKKPVGIFTERDLMRKIIPKGVDVKTTTIEAVMTPNPVCIKPETPLIKIMAAMRLGKFRHLVIIDPEGLLVGVVSIKDTLNFITDHVYE
jgi:CBS domain-containing protein